LVREDKFIFRLFLRFLRLFAAILIFFLRPFASLLLVLPTRPRPGSIAR
jgi:hypothetical protein